jgi:hypothetical protein
MQRHDDEAKSRARRRNGVTVLVRRYWRTTMAEVALFLSVLAILAVISIGCLLFLMLY